MSRELSTSKKPYIIAEAGTNHNGQPRIAIELVRAAHAAGADSVKFQIINPEGLYVPVFYEGSSSRPNPIIEERRRLMLSDSAYRETSEEARSLGLDFGASVFDQGGLESLLHCRPDYIKIASCDLNNLSFLRKVAKRAQEERIRLIMATGMSTLNEIEVSLKEVMKDGFSDIVLLHCVSVYPAAPSQMNLRFLATLSREFDLPVGLSDHTESSVCSLAALTLGAICFEKHLTLDRSQPGFDHAYAMEPAGFAHYVNDLGEAWSALQVPEEKVGEQERLVRKRARRALYAGRSMARGEVIEERDVLVVRPEGLLGADEIDLVIGKRTSRDIAAYEPLGLGMME